jgi:hypothetical protein
MSGKKVDKLTRTAYHEAGHAVASVMREIPFRHVSILRQDDNLGHVLAEPWGAATVKDLSVGIWNQRTVRRMEAEVDVLLAGAEALRRMGATRPSAGADSDNEKVVDIAFKLHGSGELVSAYIKWRGACVKELIDFNWNRVVAVAEALLKQNRLTAKQVRAICFPVTKRFKI